MTLTNKYFQHALVKYCETLTAGAFYVMKILFKGTSLTAKYLLPFLSLLKRISTLTGEATLPFLFLPPSLLWVNS